MNGMTMDCRKVNLQYVPLMEALNHFDDWKVDWDMHLTRKEIEFVKTDVKFRQELT